MGTIIGCILAFIFIALIETRVIANSLKKLFDIKEMEDVENNERNQIPSRISEVEKTD